MNRPLVGFLYNPAVPQLLEHAADLVQYLEIIPDRLWYDSGTSAAAAGPRFHRVDDAIETLKRCAEGRIVAGHGIGLSLPSAMPLDAPLLSEVAAVSAELGFE